MAVLKALAESTLRYRKMSPDRLRDSASPSQLEPSGGLPDFGERDGSQSVMHIVGLRFLFHLLHRPKVSWVLDGWMEVARVLYLEATCPRFHLLSQPVVLEPRTPLDIVIEIVMDFAAADPL
jgi:hypothetical protein